MQPRLASGGDDPTPSKRETDDLRIEIERLAAALRKTFLRARNRRPARTRRSNRRRLLGVQLDAAFHGGIVEHMGPVAHRPQGGLVFLTVRPFAVEEGGDERERGERLPVGRGIVSQENSPCLSIR